MQQMLMLAYFAIGAIVAATYYLSLKHTSDQCREVNRLRDIGDEEGARKIEEKLPSDNDLRQLQGYQDSQVRMRLYLFTLLGWPYFIFLSIKLHLDSKK